MTPVKRVYLVFALLLLVFLAVATLNAPQPPIIGGPGSSVTDMLLSASPR